MAKKSLKYSNLKAKKLQFQHEGLLILTGKCSSRLAILDNQVNFCYWLNAPWWFILISPGLLLFTVHHQYLHAFVHISADESKSYSSLFAEGLKMDIHGKRGWQKARDKETHHKGHTSFATLEFNIDWTGFGYAMLFAKRFKMGFMEREAGKRQEIKETSYLLRLQRRNKMKSLKWVNIWRRMQILKVIKNLKIKIR